MSRLNDLQEAIANQNSKGGIPSDKWMVFLLTDIALSLATITDAMTREERWFDGRHNKSKKGD